MKKKTVLFVIFTILTAITLTGCFSSQTPKTVLPAADTKVEKPKPAAVSEPDKPLSVPAGVPVLMYHSVADEKDNDAVISPALFAEQMAFLNREKYNPITLDELYAYLTEKKPLPAKPVVLTFDDGYRDTYDVVFPILKRYGFKSTLFIPAGEIGQRLTLEELKEMKAAGMAIMAHSFTHRDLGDMSAIEQASEIKKSKQTLDRLFSQDTAYFCYPNGSYTPETLKLLRENGYKLAVTINPGWVKPEDSVLELNRVWIGNSVSIRYFEERITSAHYSIL